MNDGNARTIAIIQTRIGSSRLRSKVLENLAGEPMIARVINRTHRAKALDDVIVATTTEPADDIIVDLCKERGWPFFRGSEDDVLDRYYGAALAFEADVIVRLTSDCPLIDSEIIDLVVGELSSHNSEVAYVSNTLVRTFPRGLDVEVMSFQTLRRAWQEDNNPAWREHVTPYIYRHPEKFKTRNVVNDIDYSFMRWTVDTVEDLTFVRKIYDHFRHDSFTWKDVMQLLEAHPDWIEINRYIEQKMVQ